MGVNFKFNTGGFSEGNSTATGDYSHAEGGQYLETTTKTTSIGRASHAEGASTLSIADASHVEGLLNIAGRNPEDLMQAAQELGITGTEQEIAIKLMGYAAHAEGSNNKALGSASHAEGNNNQSLANATHSEGDHTVAFGEASHSEGYSTRAEGNQSHAEGSNTLSQGNSSHAEGYYSQALGSFSHAEGSHTKAQGRDSHSEGAYTEAIGIASHVEGIGNQTTNEAQHISGKYATIDQTETSIFKVGIGTSTDARRDALNISTNGEFTFGDAKGNQVVFDTTLLQRLKDLVDVPISFSFKWDDGKYGNPYLDTDLNIIYNQTLAITPPNLNVISVDVDGNSGVVTFDSPITTFPALFYDYHSCYYRELANVYGSITEVTIPDKVTTIPSRCFYNANITVYIPSSLKKIGAYAFQHVEVMGSYEDDVLDLRNADEIGSQAFYGGGWYIHTIHIDSSKLTAEDDYVFHFPDLYTIVDYAYGDAVEYSIQCVDPSSQYIEIRDPRTGRLAYAGYPSSGGAECVAPGTKILVDSIGNTKNIEDLKEGDIVITYQDGKLIEAPLDKVVTKKHGCYINIILENGESLTISKDHAILTEDGWKSFKPILTELPKDVKQLTDVDCLYTKDGFVKISRIEEVSCRENPLVMYNIGVEGYFNYFANGICIYECSGSE